MEARDESETASNAGIRRLTLRVDVSHAVAQTGAHELAIDVILPDASEHGAPTLLMVCLPGGFLSRRYFDMQVDGDRRYSFAQRMAELGIASASIDHLGIGDSSRPADGFALGVEAISRANQAALEQLLMRLREGLDDLEPMPDLRTIGVGHSMGSALTVTQQALAAPHAALVLYSFTTAGLPEWLEESERELAHDPKLASEMAPAIVLERYGAAYGPEPDLESSQSPAFSVGTAAPPALRSLVLASTRLLAIPGLLSMIPDAYAPYAAEIDVPVYVAVGDHDIRGAEGVREMLPRAPVVETFTLDDCWHCHFVANTRTELWNRTAAWAQGILSPGRLTIE